MNRILIAGGRHKKIGRSLMKKKRFISSKSRLSSTPTSLSSVSSPLSTSHSSIPSSSFSSSLSSLISPSLLLYGGLLPTSSVSSTSTFPLISPLSSTFSKEKEKKNLLSFLCLLEEEQFYLLPKSLPLLDKDGNETSKSFFICQVPGDGGCLFHALSLSLLYQYYKINGLDSLNLLLKNLPQSLKKSLEKQEKLLGGNENEINDNNLSTSSLLSSSYSIKRFWQDLSYRLRLLACENLQSESILYLEGQDEKHSPVSTQFYPMKSRNNSPTTNIDSTSLTSTDESEKENDSEILASDLLLLSSQHYSLTPEKYIDLMKKPQTWGGGPEIISLLNHFQCPIYVYQLAVKGIITFLSFSLLFLFLILFFLYSFLDNEFVLQITAKFGHPFFKDKEPLHFLCADGR